MNRRGERGGRYNTECPGNALGVTERIDGIEGKDASVGRAGRCYHRLRSYVDTMLKRKMGLLLDDGMDRCDEEIDYGDAMMHLLAEGLNDRGAAEEDAIPLQC